MLHVRVKYADLLTDLTLHEKLALIENIGGKGKG